jgi:AcrR family transcriptional regulator
MTPATKSRNVQRLERKSRALYSVEKASRRRRRRRRPEDAQSEILEAAEAFLREHPFHAMTVDDLMTRTGLSRPSFYEYFHDRHDLVIKLVEKLRNRIFPVTEEWLNGQGDPRAELRSGLASFISIYQEHGHLMRALSAAATQDRQVAEVYGGLRARLVEVSAERIRCEIRQGRTRPLDPEETARALVVMGDRYLAEKFEQSDEPDVHSAIEALTTIWMRVLYDGSD